MNREEVKNEILKISNPNILLELPTSFGKTRIALEIMGSRLNSKSKILIVIPRNVLIENWKNEFIKWGYKAYLPYVTFVTYVSFPKVIGEWDLVIFDECHHLSERCQDSLSDFTIHNSILLSATVKRDLKRALISLFKGLKMYKVHIKDAVEEGILPNPKVYLIPLSLDNTYATYEIIKNKSKGNPLVITYADRWKWNHIKNRTIIIKCTQRQFYNDMTSLIEWYKKRTFRELFLNRFLQESGKRLKWLSEQKTSFIQLLLDKLKKERTLTFCNSISQTEELGTYCVNSNNKESQEILEMFNTGKINHITACNMLDEGE